MISPLSAGYFRKCINDPTGLARFQVKLRRLALSRDSGSTK